MYKIFRENEIVKNSNGYTYKVIKSRYDKTLFQNTDNKEFVVASYVKEYSNGIAWAWGKYTNNLIYANEEYNKY